MRIIRRTYKTLSKGRALMLSLMLLLCISTGAQTSGIVIGGNVYGGGRNGAVGINNVDPQVGEAADPIQVELNENAENNVAAEVKVFDGQILTIFGGGENGRTYGSTSVTIQGLGTTIGSAQSVNTPNGGVFGAGDGEAAYVFGHSSVLIKGGTIVQNVYGGGNKADLMGTTQVTLQGGTLNEAVYGGSRLANIYGYSLVNIDGTNAAQDLVIKAVYGGNDIAGHIEASSNWDWTISTNLQLPANIFSHATTNGITSISGQLTVTDYNSFVHSSPEANGRHIFVGQVFGGGNGDYGQYLPKPNTDSLTVSALGTTFTVASKPEVQKSYIELRGGTFGYVYGGGNNATVTDNVDICLDNSTTPANLYVIDKQLLDAMGVSTNSTFTTPTQSTVKPTYQFDRVFGGNNKAEMAIQPKWHLIRGTINNLYSGGNEGNMTWKKGLLLELNADSIKVNTVYGGCRRADVTPMDGGVAVTSPALEDEDKGYAFPAGLSARVFITKGTINNVYGGNDISGNVVGGNALDIRSSILGDVYGGGNGSYAYTDNPQLASHEYYRDFYYSTQGYNSSAEALNAFRPNAQQAWIHVSGTADKPTLIGGSLYCGGNSATLSITENDNTKMAALEIGSYVIVDNVFLGSNGENMIDDDMMALYHDGTVDNKTFSTINMTNDFEKYIEGVSLGIRPSVSFEDDYVNNSTQIGSFFVGGNLGSITASGTFEVEFEKPVIIYDKLVAGCNDANYSSSDPKHINNYGIDYKGGIKNNTGIDNDGVKIRLNVGKVTLMPKRIVRDNNGTPIFDNDGKPQLEWNLTDISEGSIRLKGANIYGGCYTSGYINGGVEINLNGPAMRDDQIFDDPETQAVENSGIVKEDQQQDVLGRAMSVFGGGMGEKTEIWGNTTVNIGENGYILQAFGGGEKGVVGKDLGNGSYTQYNATINLNGGSVDEIYGGGFEGFVSGNTTVNVLSGNAVDVFGGACNADVGGLATVYVGGDASGASSQPIPTVQNVFGGNDYSGKIGTISGLASKTGYNNETVLTNTYVEYLQGEIDSIFGGSYGSYDYPNNVNPPFIENSFVNFKPNSKNGNKVDLVFGGGWGDPEIAKNNEMQQRSYVLVNAPSNVEHFTNTDIFGSGAFSGLGMNKTPALAAAKPDSVTAKVVLVSGKVNNVYGSSYKSGFTRRTNVVVPSGSTINVKNIFGGGYGDNLGTVCDTYEANVNYSSNDATVENIYGGNNNSRRTIYSFVNVESAAYSNRTKGYTATVYGAGYGADTWTQYTEINLKNGATVYEAYGGGNAGMVLNKESENAFTTYTYQDEHGDDQTGTIVKTIGSGYDNDQILEDLTNPLVHANRLGKTTNTNVYIWKGATVVGYCYGGGLGDENLMATNPNLGLVSGTTYIGVHGGKVTKDLYAAGTSGAINRLYTNLTFTPETNTYLEGGSVRNIYGGGWKGDVGSKNNNIVGNSYVVIGTLEENFTANETGYNESYGFYKGQPTVQRNAYAGGEGGAVYGLANLTMNSGRIGYEYTNGQYVEKIEDDTHVDNEGNLIPNTNLMDSGNIFGGGYKEASDVDNTNIIMWGGLVRNSLYGGGEIATVGRGVKEDGSVTINKKGHTHVEIYNGQVLHDVFGGGKGYDNLGRVGENLHTDGYVFGSTEVYIYGGEVGTEEGAKNGLGNVFGGGNVGYVYSGDGTKGNDGYYYDSNHLLTEDCKVVVSPYAKVLADDIELYLLDEEYHEIANSRKTFHKNEYVPTEYLNCLGKQWINNDKRVDKKLDWVTGVTIHNAVFAGGNVSSGSNVLYANAKTVYGNATAALNDVYHCDLITVGTEHIGGLYGDGNLTFVDGYRELNITNYGTDYYGQSDVITIQQYNEMNDRERAYFELKYKCVQACTDDVGEPYSPGASLPEDDLRKNFRNGTNTQVILGDGSIDSDYWVESGFCSIYAGRLLNTIQRADFVGVFGSRMVMQGSRDRVVSVVDYTDYTINRVGEVSLNQKHSTAGDSGDDESFGNYFGIYNIVNHLGALTSDVDYYDDVRTTKNGDNSYNPDYAGQTYEEWKTEHINDRKRNNGASANKVALAAGVYLELTTEESTPDNKVWGVATGVMELDLINVMAGLGGGYVYAKNVHGVRSTTSIQQVTLSKYNEGATSKKQYTYTTDDNNAQETQTSGNFVHSIKQIFDDCYPQSNSYKGADAAPAHYWFIKGQIYLYNQYISAYTGAAEAYSKTINIPLTVTAGSHGTLKIQNVQPNKYAYYSSYVDKNNNVKLENDGTKVVNNITYHLNDTITYWEWSMLSETDKKLFVDTTYVTIADCEVGNGHTPYSKGSVILPQDYKTLLESAETKVVDGESVKAVYHVDKGGYVAFTDVFRSSNNISHDNGYILTYDVTNPEDWNAYYSPSSRSGVKLSSLDYSELSDADKLAYIKAPTYSPTTSKIYGQRHYNKGEIITQAVKNTYDQTIGEHPLNQEEQAQAAQFERAYVLTKKVTIQNPDGTESYLNAGYVMPYSDYTDKGIGADGAAAMYCTNTFELKREGYEDQLIYWGKNLTETQIEDLVRTYICYGDGTTEAQIQAKKTELLQNYFTQSYYCTREGLYGGGWFDSNKNYSGLTAWSSLPAEDRSNFTFNYDGLDLLIDPLYRGDIRYYDTPNGDQATLYALEKPLDYSALYMGNSPLTYMSSNNTQKTIDPTDPNAELELSRVQYEDIPNEKYHYAPFNLTDQNDHVYIVKEAFIRGDVPYSVGNKLDYETYNNLSYDQALKVLDITGHNGGTYYFCRDAYEIETISGRGTAVENAFTGEQKNPGDHVPIGFILDETHYDHLINQQLNFAIYGKTPIVTSTFFVSGQSNIKDLSKGRIITVIYQYNYEESDETGSNIEPITERHIVNIHINFKSGTPTIGQLGEPSIVLPGSSIGLTPPEIKPGAYEVIGGGWELFASKDEAEKHVNGVEFDNVDTKLYWYQNNGYHVAYYAKTYLGKTYSNPVPVKVANYHDLDMVMRDKAHHMYIDNPNVERNSKIYIDSRKSTADENKSKLDLLKDLFELSLQQITLVDGEPQRLSGGELDGHIPLDDHVKGGANLEFILRSDVAPKKYTTWTPIGNASNGFMGTLHGDGYTISGLTSSLFGNLCDSVYNLGVTGSFTGSGIADLGTDGAQSNPKVGYAENCWIMTTGTISGNIQPVLGNGGVTKNCYYPDNLTYATKTGTKAMPITAFHNGEVAYNLNGFYLTKRYADNNGVNTYPYKYYEIANNSTNTLESSPSTGYYNFAAGDAKYSYGTKTNLGYVESRYMDGDFIYASGSIPTVANERRYYVPTPENETPDPDNGLYYPIWPDDYIFFGQMLTYGYTENISGREYQEYPSRINKADRAAFDENSNASQWLVLEDIHEFSNRIYRTPAYYGDKNPHIIHHNAYAVVPAKTSDNVTNVYPGLTAIDFTALSDYNNNGQAIWQEGWSGDVFNKMVLDHTNLIAFRSDGQTKNLLVYAESENDADILSDYFNEPAYGEINSDYRNVALVTQTVRGHLVMKEASGNGYIYKADGNHYLVDGEDFNAPISYSFGTYASNAYYHMWYQRLPQNYVTSSAGGWETISLPFTAELVTTQDKGEITHFYTNNKVGHEYWLREFDNVETDENDNTKTNVLFSSLAVGNTSKTVTNTFLWDHYYYDNRDNVDAAKRQKDKNNDTYQTYYNSFRTYSDYPMLTAGKPYLIGFPGVTYYEFDLSGNFSAINTATAPSDIGRQIITFVSVDGYAIGVTDDEYTRSKTNGHSAQYTFVPTYQTKSVGDAQTDVYMLADNGTKMANTTDAVTVPFRAYMTSAASQGAPTRSAPRRDVLYISYTGDTDSMEEVVTDRGLSVYSDHMNICVESTLEYSAMVTITNIAGKVLKQFTIQPGTRATVPVNNIGVYIVNHHKIAVTR